MEGIKFKSRNKTFLNFLGGGGLLCWSLAHGCAVVAFAVSVTRLLFGNNSLFFQSSHHFFFFADTMLHTIIQTL